MKHKSLFVFSLGPVQSFIAASRKVVDLWSGSYLLSYLIEEGIKKSFDNDLGLEVEMIFPNETKETIRKKSKNTSFLEVASYPNRFFCRLTSSGTREDHEESIHEFARVIHDHIRHTFIQLSHDALNRFSVLKDSDSIKEMARQQIIDSLEMFWAFEYEEGPYEEVRIRVEKMLASAKNNRDYQISKQKGLICTVCNQRETLLLERASKEDSYAKLIRKTEDTWRYVREKRYRDSGERLCSLCFTKRLAQSLFSEKYKNIKGRNQFTSFESTKEFARPYKYYGLLLMDGDDMGKWISAVEDRYLEGFPKEEEIKAEYHKEISKRLTNYSRKVVPMIVRKNEGTLIYSGGDDVLAFAPIDKIFKLAGELREAFGHAEKGLDRKATASMGIIIVHEEEPFQKVLNNLRGLEERAKSFRNSSKNAFALGVHSRSGEIREITLPWSSDYSNNQIYKYGSEQCIPSKIDKVARYLSNELSMNFIYKYGQSFLPLLAADILEEEKIQPFQLTVENRDEDFLKRDHLLVQSEIHRLVSRSLENKDLPMAKEISNTLFKLYHASASFLESVHLLEALRFLKLKNKRIKEEV